MLSLNLLSFVILYEGKIEEGKKKDIIWRSFKIVMLGYEITKFSIQISIINLHISNVLLEYMNNQIVWNTINKKE